MGNFLATTFAHILLAYITVKLISLFTKSIILLTETAVSLNALYLLLFFSPLSCSTEIFLVLFTNFNFFFVLKLQGYLHVTKKHLCSTPLFQKILLDVKLSQLPHCVCFLGSDESHNLRINLTTFLYYIKDN